MGTSRVVVVTGANAGIGRQTAVQLAAAGHTVIAVSRDRGRGEAAVEAVRARTGSRQVQLEVADLADFASLRVLAARVRQRYPVVHALINNASVFDLTQRRRTLTRDGHEVVWQTNHLAPFLLTALLMDRLLASEDGRVVTVASKGLVSYPRIRIRFGDVEGEGWYTPTKAYYQTKLAQIMTSYALARHARDAPLTVASVRVPAVRLDPDRLAALPTRLRLAYAPKRRFALPPEELARTYARLATGPAAEIAPLNGRYVTEDLKLARSPRSSYDQDAQERLWRLTQEQTGEPAWPPPATRS